MSRAGWLAAIAAVIATAGAVVTWQAEPIPSVSAAVPLDGATVFRTRGCSSCHSGPDTAAHTGSQFPGLSDAAAWAGDRRPGLSAREYMSESIREPTAFASPVFADSAGPTSAMPELGLSDSEVKAVVDYLLLG